MENHLIENLRLLKARDKSLTYSTIANWLDETEAVVKNYFLGKTPIPEKHLIILSDKMKFNSQTIAMGPLWLPGGEHQTLLKQIRRPRAAHNSTSNYKVTLRTMLTPIVEDLPEATYELFQAEGSSMIPTVYQDDWLLCRLDSCDKIIDGRVYVLVIDNNQLNEFRKSGIWIKRIWYRRQQGYISCKSDNIDGTEGFSTFRVKVSDVQECWYPVKIITGQLADPHRDIYAKLDDLEARLEEIESELNLER